MIKQNGPCMLQWKLDKKNLPLRFLWKIARGSLETKESFFLSLHNPADGSTAMGEVAPNTRYHNTPEVILTDFTRFEIAARGERRPDAILAMTLVEFERWLDGLKLCNTLRFGIESAWVHLKSALLGQTVPQFLGIPAPGRIVTSFSVPIMETEKLEEFIRPLARFHALKIKVDADSAVESIERITRLTNQKLRIDGNEAWTDPSALMQFIEGIRHKNIEFIEQPMPSDMRDAYREVLPRFPFPLIGDESIEDRADYDDLATQFSGVNVKLMKTGGYSTAVDLLKGARARGMKTMLGCMVETSLGISSAMNLCALVDYADLDGFLLLKDDPFGLVREENGVLTRT